MKVIVEVKTFICTCIECENAQAVNLPKKTIKYADQIEIKFTCNECGFENKQNEFAMDLL